MTKILYQCVKCTKLFEHWLDLNSVKMGDDSNYYLCDECIKEREIIQKKDLNTSEVIV